MHNRTAPFDIDVVYKQCLARGFNQTFCDPIIVNRDVLIVAGFVGSPTTAQCGCIYVGRRIIWELSRPRLRSPFVVLHCCSQKALVRDRHIGNLKKTLEFLHSIIDEIPKLHAQHDCIHLFPN